MTEDEKLTTAAKQWVRANKKRLINEFCDPAKYPSVDNPITIFMAGTPGAGKTEFSQSLLETFHDPFVRIDADEIRELMREVGYSGKNAHLFQNAANKAVNILFDHANRKNGQNVLLDGTFAYGDWRTNVQRSLNHDRKVEIYYLYQDPKIAWGYVEARRKKHGRAVPKDAFVKSYVNSASNVERAKEVFGEQVILYFAKNNYKKEVERVEVDVADLEKFLPKRYTEDELIEILHEE